jgi:hypothetical protein
MLGCVALLTVAPAALAQTGSITGEVKNFFTLGPIPGVTVTAYRENGAVAGSPAKTNALGEYTIEKLAGPINYKVEFSGAGFVPQYFEGQSSFGTAKPVEVKEGEATMGVRAAMIPGGELSGRVTDAATNLPAANVSVRATNTNTGVTFPSWSTVTNGNGEYIMLGLEAGPYRVEFAAAEPGAAQYISQTRTGVGVILTGTRNINVALERKAIVNTGPPVLSGTPAVGQKLSCSNGSWTGLAPITFTIAWLREGGLIGGAAGSTYAVQTADQGRGLACQVTAANAVSRATATSNTLKVPAAPPAPPPPPPPPLVTITGVSQSNSRWRAGNRLASYSRTKRPPVGTTFRFILNQRAPVTFAFTQQVGGRNVGGKCVAQTNRNRRSPSCKRTVTQGTLTFTGRSGLNKVAFQGRISGSKKLSPGAYTLQITALNSAGKRSSGRSLNFTIVR